MGQFTPRELRLLRSLNEPWKIQRFLDEIPYHQADTAYSPLQVLRHRTAHCLEAATFAAAALKLSGRPPLLVDLEAFHDTDHVICVFRENGGWGACATSSYVGLRYRPPVYKTLRELAISYFNDYINKRRERTLRTFSQPVNLNRFNKLGWMTREDNIWFIAEHLCDIPHTPLLSRAMERELTPVDRRALGAGTFGMHIKK